MPYIYSLAGKVHLDDYTSMRPLIMEFPNDKATTNISDEFMFGDALLVAPVYEYGARNRDIYFPATNGWYDFYTGKFVKGGQTLNIDAPYEQIPLFVRTGAIIPFGPDIQHTQANDNSNVTIYVYKGNDGAFTIYEDQGTNNNYEKGEYSTIPLTYNEATSTLTIGERKGSYEGMPATRNFEIVVVSQENPIGYDVNRKGKKVKYNGKTQKIKL